jgi:hypothetical protein
MIKRFVTVCVGRGDDMLTKHTIVAVFLAGSLVVGPALATEKTDVNLGELDCRALLQMNGDDEQSTVVFLHGYASGKAGTTAVNIPALTEATDKIRSHCIDNPSDKLLDLFSKFR